jgi:hypothetical protein
MVQLMDGQTVLGTGPASSGVFSLTVALSPGIHSITAVCPGDANLYPGASAALSQTVQANTTVTVSTPASRTFFGQPVTFTATVAPSTAGGTVQFLNDGAPAGSAPIVNGAATLTLPNLTAGNHTIRAVYGGDGVHLGSSSDNWLQIVNLASTQVTLASSANPALAGQTVTFTVTLSPSAATGSVQFRDGATVMGTVTVTDGSASFSASTLSAGSHAIYAMYLGDANCSSAASAILSQTVNKAASSVSLAADHAAITSGQSVTLTATVAPAAASGTVQFLDGAMLLGTAALSNGSAAFTATGLSAGAHSITAVYDGDANTTGSSSAAVSVTVSKAAATVTVASSANPSTVGQSVTFTATVTPPAATGSVQFLDGATPIGTGTLSGGSASVSAPALTAGSHSITAVYSGDATYNSGTSVALAQTVNHASSSTTASASSGSITVGQSVTLTAAVTPSSATGTVQFLDGATVLGAAALSGGAASIAATGLAVGTHSITAVYGGDAANNGSTSAAVTVTVAKAAASVTATSSLNPSVAGQTVTFTATVTPLSATGSVQFLDGATPIGTAALIGGTASLSASGLAAGAHSITAVYSGDGNHNGAASGAFGQVVRAITTTALAADKPTAVAGEPVTFTAMVTPATGTGTVQFVEGANVIGTAAVSGGTASIAVSNLAVGVHSVTALYGGAAAYAPSASGPAGVTIVAALPPSNLAATAASANRINLSWTASATPGVTYNIYASSSSGFVPSAGNRIASGVTGTSYAHTGLASGTTVYYVVTAQNGNGESTASNQAGAATKGSGSK